MKTPTRHSSRRALATCISGLLPVLALLGRPEHAAAQTYTWTGALTAGPTAWNVDANWGGTPNPFPNAVGDIANLTADFTAAPTIDLSTGITIGTLVLNDTGASGDVAITVAAGGGSLIFDNTGSTNAVLTSNGATNVISAAIQLNDGLDVTTTGSLSLTNNITESGGAKNITKLGNATLTLSGTNSYTGTTTASAGLLLTTKAAALAGYNVAGKAVFNGGILGIQFGTGGWTLAELDALLASATKTSGALGVDNNSGTAFSLTTLLTTTSLGTLGLSKVGGNNTVTLTNSANSYTGDTSVANGTLAAILNGDIALSTDSVLGNSATAIIHGTAATSGNSAMTFNAGSDAGNYTIFRGFDFSQGAGTSTASINFNSNSAGGLNTNTLTLAGDLTLDDGRGASIRAQRTGMTVNITGNIFQPSGTAALSMGTFAANPGADGRGAGTVRFSNLARSYAGANNLIMGTMQIDGVVGALNTASPIGFTAITLNQGSGGNLVGGANFNGNVPAANDTSPDTIRSVFLESAGSSYARILNPGTGTNSGPAQTATAKIAPSYVSNVGVINAFQFGGRNTTGTVTFSGAITPQDIDVGNSATNPIITAVNMALIAENGGTTVFSGAISDTPTAATELRVTINQLRNHPNIDGVNNASGNAGNYTGTVGADGLADTATANVLVGTAKTGTVVLNAANSYVGTTEVLGGTLRLGNANALGFGGRQALATGTTTVASGAVLDVNGQTAIHEPIILNGTGISAGGALVNNSGTAASIGSGLAGLQLGTIAGTGSGYSTAPTVLISGTGTGATATASLGLTQASITSVSGGTNWVVGEVVNITGGGGTGATAIVSTTGAGGSITGLTLNRPGSGYTGSSFTMSKNDALSSSTTNGTIVGNGNNFAVTGLNLTNAGSGYTGTPTYTFGSGNAVPGTTTLSSVTLASDSSIGGSGDLAIFTVVSESGGSRTLTKVGAGSLSLNAANTYSGGTTLNEGTLVAGNNSALGTQSVTFNGGKLAADNDSRTLANSVVVNNVAGNQITGSNSLTLTGNASGAGTLEIALSNAAKAVTVNPGTTNGFAPAAIKVTSGTLLLGGAEKLGDSTALTLGGGVFSMEGLHGATETLASLTLSANSTLDFGTGSYASDLGNTLRFNTLNLSTYTLAVYNWSGPFYLPGAGADSGTANQDRLLFASGGLSGQNLAQVSFYSDAGATLLGTGQQISFGGAFPDELAPIPEPGTVCGALALLGLVGYRERRRLAAAWLRAKGPVAS